MYFKDYMERLCPVSKIGCGNRSSGKKAGSLSGWKAEKFWSLVFFQGKTKSTEDEAMLNAATEQFCLRLQIIWANC